MEEQEKEKVEASLDVTNYSAEDTAGDYLVHHPTSNIVDLQEGDLVNEDEEPAETSSTEDKDLGR